MGEGAPSIVFFGMDSGFATLSLRALISAGLSPSLVVVGVEKPRWQRGPVVDLVPAHPSKLERFFGTGSYDPPPGGHDLTAVALGEGVDALRTSDANALRSRARVAGAMPDAFVVASFPHLLSANLLSLAKQGGLNVHPGALPGQRGPSPLFWSLKRGDASAHFTIHVLDAGEDTGDVVASGRYDFAPGAHGADVLRGLAEAAAPHLVRALRALLAGDLVRMPQSKQGAARCPRPSFRDARIDPAQPAEVVFTFAAGCAGAYPLFVECGGDRFFIARATSYDPKATLPCEFFLSGDRLLLRCAPGVVELELRPDGAIFTGDYTERDGR